jgi:catechol 2,3-dioxygenase-like lactoylglutathione lyase family enzyme
MNEKNLKVNSAITFFYYKDTEKANQFYQDVMGFELAVDQGWSKIYRIVDNAFMGVVDESKGAHRANEIKPVELTLVVDDPDAWHTYLLNKGIKPISEPRNVESMNLRMFLLHDPEGYLIEIQKFL